ncbi:MAG: hypothetical protein WCI02_02480 [Planctomycetota bacterium]
MRHSLQPQRAVAGSILGLLVLLSGCQVQVTNTYGESEGDDAECSPSGLTVLRSMVEKKGHTTYTVRSLSPSNMNRLNTILWAPNAFPSHSAETYRWLAKWCASGNRTLIYVGRDFSPNQAYWSSFGLGEDASLSSQDRFNALSMAAQEESELDTMRRAYRKRIYSPWNRWVIADGEMERINEWTGPWASSLDADACRIYLRTHAEPLQDPDLAAARKLLDWEPDPTKPVNAAKQYAPEWRTTDVQQREISQNWIEGQFPIRTVLLQSGDGRDLIARYTEGSLSNSQLILVANQSLFSNYGLIHRPHRDLAQQLIAGLPTGGVGFITGSMDPPVRSDDLDERQKGFEMLTIWPLNVITIHAAFLGVAAMIAAFPIFGRPFRLPKKSTSDFGQHIDAVGEMMQRSGDREYAVRTIAEYFRQVRKDTVSPWATIDKEFTTTQSPFASVSSPPVQSGPTTDSDPPTDSVPAPPP